MYYNLLNANALILLAYSFMRVAWRHWREFEMLDQTHRVNAYSVIGLMVP